jgi:hypothetical protein
MVASSSSSSSPPLMLFLEEEGILLFRLLTLLNSLLSSPFLLIFASPGTKIQLQKLFNEISKVAEKCLYEASKYGEVSHTWCIVAVVVAGCLSSRSCSEYCRVEMPIVSREIRARFLGRSVHSNSLGRFFKIDGSGYMFVKGLGLVSYVFVFAPCLYLSNIGRNWREFLFLLQQQFGSVGSASWASKQILWTSLSSTGIIAKHVWLTRLFFSIFQMLSVS